MKLIEIKPDESIEEVIEQTKEMSKDLSGLIVLALTKDGEPIMMTSRINGMEKAFLAQFMQSWFSNTYFAGTEEL